MRHRLLWLVLVVIAAAAPHARADDAGVSVAEPADAGVVDAGVVADAGVAADAVDERTIQLEALLRLELPKDNIADLVGVDLDDDAAVAEAAAGLRAELAVIDAAAAAAAAAAVDAGPDAGAISPSVPPTEAASTRLRRLRLTVLELPASVRSELLRRQREQRRQAQEARAVEAERAASAAAIRAAQEAADVASGRGRAIAEARVTLERLRAEQAEGRARLAADAAELEALGAAWRKQLNEVSAQLDAANAAAAVDVVYDRLVQELSEMRATLAAATANYVAVVDGRRAPELQLPSALSADQELAVTELRAMAAELNTNAQTLDDEARASARVRAERAADVLDELNGMRLTALGRLSPQKRDQILGFGETGLKQLRREVEHAVVVARFLWRVEVPAAGGHARSLSAFTLTRVSLQAMAIVLVLVLAANVARRGRRWLEALKVISARLLGRRVLTRWVATIVSAFEAVWGELVVVVAVLVIGQLASSALEYAAGSITFGLILAWAILRLVVAVVHQTIRFLARPQLGALSPERSAKAFASVRFVGRAIFTLFIFLNTTEALVGRGSLYSVATRVGVVLSLPVALLLIRRWQDDIAETYLRLQPKGRLAHAVRQTRERWFNFVVVLGAFGVVASQAILAVASRFILNFDQTRKALAFVFRRRLERKAREQPEPVSTVLPDDVQRALVVKPADEGDVIAERLIDLDETVADVVAFAAGKSIARSTLVIGQAGFGKTTWLMALERRARAEAETLEVTTCALQGRVLDERGVVVAVAKACGFEDVYTVGRLVASLRGGPKRLLIIDDAHLLWLRGVHERAAWRALQSLIFAVADHVFVAVACDAWTFAHVAWADGDGVRTERTVTLTPWSEAEIRTLLQGRTTRCGHVVLYDDLVIATADSDNRELQLLTTAQEYTRLLWDFAEGNPATALDAWRRSLRAVSLKTLAVRLFSQPPEQVLEQLSSVGRFALASVMWNGAVRAPDAARALRLPPGHVRDTMMRLERAGVLEKASGGFRVSTTWWSVTVRYLRRKHLLAD